MNKRIYRYDFNKALDNMPNISPKEKDYLNKVFGRELRDGLTSWELKQKMGRLQSNKEDELDQWELQSIKRKMLDKLDK